MSNDIGKTLNFVSQKDIANNQPSPCWDHFISEHSWHFQVSLFVLIILEPTKGMNQGRWILSNGNVEDGMDSHTSKLSFLC